MPENMKAVGGVGNGIFEIAQDLAGYENLCILGFEEPELYAKIFENVGKFVYDIWEWFLKEYADAFCVCRFGDDLGFKSNCLIKPEDIREHIIPQYKKIIALIHGCGKPFLLHCCGCIFSVMDDLIDEAKIDAKHSNEDQIADYSVWIEKYGKKIGNFGGIDTDHICRASDALIVKLVTDLYNNFGKGHGGLAIGSGNSIPDYADKDKYLLMLNTVRSLRGDFN
jgi:uroporphyrinogen decarboxylase